MSVEIWAGKAFQELLDSSPERQAEWARMQDRCQSWMFVAFYLSEEIQAGLQQAKETLAKRYLPVPQTLEGWEDLAHFVEMPRDIIKSGEYSIRRVYEHAIAWADWRDTDIKAKSGGTPYDLLYTYIVMEGRSKEASLLRFMSNRYCATYQEILDGVYKGKKREWETVATLVKRLKRTLSECTDPEVKEYARKLRFYCSDPDQTVTKEEGEGVIWGSSVTSVWTQPIR
jgi:hypothetical protein